MACHTQICHTHFSWKNHCFELSKRVEIKDRDISVALIFFLVWKLFNTYLVFITLSLSAAWLLFVRKFGLTQSQCVKMLLRKTHFMPMQSDSVLPTRTLQLIWHLFHAERLSIEFLMWAPRILFVRQMLEGWRLGGWSWLKGREYSQDAKRCSFVNICSRQWRGDAQGRQKHIELVIWSFNLN